ncbi:dipeptidase, partial [Gemmatimonadota bacterium]
VPGIILGACAPSEMSEEDVLAHAHEIHAGLLTIDTHVDIGGNFATAESDPGMRGSQKVDLPKMREGGLDAVFFAVYVGQTERTPENYEQVKADAMVKFEAIHRMAEDMYPDQIEIAYSADDIEQINAGGKLVAVVSVENGYAIAQDISLVETYFDLGARAMTLTHGGHNDIGDSSTPRDFDDEEEQYGGLSEFGREVVAEMNRVGMIIDISHVSINTMLQTAELSEAPIIASHSGARALADHPRNLNDEQLMALKENGGVVHVVALNGFLKVMPEKDAAEEALQEEMGVSSREARRAMEGEQREEYDRRMAELDERWPPANLETYVDHIDYIVQLIGIDHVGIGTDFDGGGGIEGFNDASEAPNVTAELIRRGYSDEDIAKIWGGNLLKVLRANESVASQIQGDGHTN